MKHFLLQFAVFSILWILCVQVLRFLLVLGLATLLDATRENQAVSVKFKQGTRLKGKTVRLVLDPSVQTQINSMSSSNIPNMSISPWTYRWGITGGTFFFHCFIYLVPQTTSLTHVGSFSYLFRTFGMPIIDVFSPTVLLQRHLWGK